MFFMTNFFVISTIRIIGIYVKYAAGETELLLFGDIDFGHENRVNVIFLL